MTYRPCELERDDNLASVVDFVLCALKVQHISTENLRRSGSKGAGPPSGDVQLILLEAHLEVSVTLILHTAQILMGAPGAVAALPARQLAVHILD